MNKLFHLTIASGLIFMFLFTGCGTAADKPVAPVTIESRASRVIALLADGDWQTLYTMVHPQHGLRFSPYAYVDVEYDVVIPADSVAALSADRTVRTWGAYDGTGDPIELTFSEYYKQFVYDKNFAQTRTGEVDKVIQRGNTRVNIRQVYNGEQFRFVEYYVPGTEKYDGMDWASLYLVFERFENDWRLVGIVHDQWTI